MRTDTALHVARRLSAEAFLWGTRPLRACYAAIVRNMHAVCDAWIRPLADGQGEEERRPAGTGERTLVQGTAVLTVLLGLGAPVFGVFAFTHVDVASDGERFIAALFAMVFASLVMAAMIIIPCFVMMVAADARAVKNVAVRIASLAWSRLRARTRRLKAHIDEIVAEYEGRPGGTPDA